jgi:hypothetical protein
MAFLDLKVLLVRKVSWVHKDLKDKPVKAVVKSWLSTRFLKYTNVFELAIPTGLGHIVAARKCADYMPRNSPFSIVLTQDEEREIRHRAAKYTLPYFQVFRAKIVLLAAQNLPNDLIAARLNTRREVVSQWRKRFFYERLRGLEELPRPGRPRAFPPRTGRAG